MKYTTNQFRQYPFYVIVEGETFTEHSFTTKKEAVKFARNYNSNCCVLKISHELIYTR